MNERKLTKAELKKREDIIMNMKGNKRDLVKKYGKDAEAVMYGRATNMAKKQAESMKNPKLTELIKDALKNPKKADLNKDGELSDYEKKRGAAIEKSMTKEGIVNEDKQEAADELQMIMDQLYELSDQAKMIFRNNFPGEYNRLDAYGALDFGTSSNRFDVTLEGTLENLDMEDDDEDLMNEYDSAPPNNNIFFKGKTKAGNNPNADKEEKVDEDLDLGHEDNEPGMLKGDLYKIGKYSMELYQMMDDLEGQGEVDFPHWWQSKIITAKNMISGAKHYLDFELKEPAIDAVVDATIDVVDEDTSQLGTDDDTGFQASLYTPNEMGAAAVGRESASGAFESVSRNLAKKLKEGLPKGYWDKKIDAKDEDQDGKVDEDLLKKGGKLSNALNALEAAAKDAKISGDKMKELFAKFKQEMSISEEDRATRADKMMSGEYKDEDYKESEMYDDIRDEVDESYDSLVKKIEKQGKSKKAAKAIAGAIASYKSKGGGKGPTAKQKLDEYTENNFSGNALIAQTPQPGRDELATYDYFFPDGVASRSNAISSLQAHDESPIKARMGRYAPMFAHVQYHEFEDEAAEKYRVHQTQYYNSNFKDKDPNFNPGVTKLTLFKLTPSGDTDKEVDMGSILVKTDEYIKDLKNLNITNRQS